MLIAKALVCPTLNIKTHCDDFTEKLLRLSCEYSEREEVEFISTNPDEDDTAQYSRRTKNLRDYLKKQEMIKSNLKTQAYCVCV